MAQTVVEHEVLGGTDGFRGEATLETGPGKMNAETIAGLTYALVGQQIEAGENPLCIIGRDTRPSGPLLEEAAVVGAVAAGAEVYRMHIAPTPAVLKTAQMFGAGSAVVLSASHNTSTDNGWKGTLGADKPYGQQVADISDRYWSAIENGLDVATDLRNKAFHKPDLVEAYRSAVVFDIENTFGERPLDGKHIVVDGANGAAMNVTPTVLRRLGATVYEFACDGSAAINDGSGATDLNGVKRFLRRNKEISFGPNFLGVVSNDGDADRMIGQGVGVNYGQLDFKDLTLDGNRVMELLAQKQPGIVGTDYTNDATVTRLLAKGIGFRFCRNGDVNVSAELRSKQAEGQHWTRGGEFTGHHVDLDWLSSGDGVRMAAWVAAFAASQGTNFAELSRSMPLWPERMVKVKVPFVDRTALLGQSAVQTQIGRLEQLLDDGRVLVRPSGTEAGIIRVWGVGPDTENVHFVTSHIAKVITDHGL